MTRTDAVQARDAAQRIVAGCPAPDDGELLARWALSAIGNVRVTEDYGELRFDVQISRIALLNVRDARGLVNMHAEQVRRALAYKVGVLLEPEPRP